MDVQELIQSIDIVEYISQFVDLEQRGDEWWGLSCFKNERTPSFSVRQDPPVFYDYSSGIGGNVFTFTRYYYKCSKNEAYQKLLDYVGAEADAIKTPKLLATIICKKFARTHTISKQSIVTALPDNYMDKYDADQQALAVWEREGISREVLDRFQVRYDKFSRRLVYPIRDAQGKIVNVGGRTIDPQWKEKGLKKYNYFMSWGSLTTIYGLAENLQNIKQSGEIILFEGCKSVLLASSFGVQNTGAILTSHLNPHQMKMLARLGCRVVFALDKDVNILNDHNIQRLARYVNVEYICDDTGLLDEKDAPVDKGAEVFRELYNKRRKFSE